MTEEPEPVSRRPSKLTPLPVVHLITGRIRRSLQSAIVTETDNAMRCASLRDCGRSRRRSNVVRARSIEFRLA